MFSAPHQQPESKEVTVQYVLMLLEECVYTDSLSYHQVNYSIERQPEISPGNAFQEMGTEFWLQKWLLCITGPRRSHIGSSLISRTQAQGTCHREARQMYNFFFHRRPSAGTCLLVTSKAMQRCVKAQDNPIATNKWEFKPNVSICVHLRTQHMQVSVAEHFRRM